MFTKFLKNIAAVLSYFIYGGVAAILFFSCDSVPSIVHTLGNITKAPTQSMYNSSSIFTEDGKVQLKLQYPVLYNYSKEKTYQLFPEGIIATFYDELGGKNLDLYADSAINLQEDDLMKFYKDVVVYDYRTGDTIYTEALYWNQRTKRIHSDVYVKKIGPNMVLEGDGFDADEQMIDVVLRNTRGVML